MGDILEEQTRKWQRWESNPIQSQGSGAFSIAINRVAKPVKGGDYKISFGCEIRILAPGATAYVHVECEIDGNKKCDFVSTFDQFDTKNGWDFVHFNDGDTPQITMRFKRENSVGTVEIRKIKMSIERKK